MDNILNITENYFDIDDSIESFEYREYEPDKPLETEATSGEINISANAQDAFIYPAKSYLLVKGRLASTTNVAFDNASSIALTNNAIPYLFKEIFYKIGTTTVESTMHPGHVSTMRGLLSYGDDFTNGASMCWIRDTDRSVNEPAVRNYLTNEGFKLRKSLIMDKPHTSGNFSFVVPLKHLLGFFQDYRRVMYGVKHTLTFVRAGNDFAIHKRGAVAAIGGAGDAGHRAAVEAFRDGKIILNKFSWIIPHVVPNLKSNLSITKIIESKIKIPIAFRAYRCDTLSLPERTTSSWRLAAQSGSEKPRWILITFQTVANNDQTVNHSVFDHCNVKNVYCTINTERYPFSDMNTNFQECDVAQVYKNMTDFKEQFYGVSEYESGCGINLDQFINLYPIFVIDLRHQSERLKNTMQDIQIRMEFNQNPPANTTAYAVLISDKLMSLESDGNRFHVVY